MKKIIVLFSFVAVMSFGGSAFAAGENVSDCAKMGKGHVSDCAKEMERGVSNCATSPDCPMKTGC